MTQENGHNAEGGYQATDRNEDGFDMDDDRVTAELTSNRRGFLKNSALLGTLSVSGAFYGATMSSGDTIKYIKRYEHKNHKEVEDGAKPERRPIYDKMKINEWEKMETGEDGIDNVISTLNDRFGNSALNNIFVGMSTVDSKNNKEITVEYNIVEDRNGNRPSDRQPEVPFDKIVAAVPDEITGMATSPDGKTYEQSIPVSCDKSVFTLDGCNGNHYNSDYGEKIPGAARYETDSGGGPCTLATPAHHEDEGHVILSAGHCVDDASYIINPNDDNDHNDGDISEWIDDSARDFARIKPSGSEDYQYDFSDDSGGYDSPIMGTFSWKTIKHMESNDSTMKKRGRTTGQSSGTVDTTGKDSNGYRFFNVKNMASNGGDSGGPHYDWPDGKGIHITGIHSGSWGSCPDTKSNAGFIGDAEDQLEVTV